METENETVQTKPIAETITPLIQRQVEPEEEEEEPIQAKLVDSHLLQRQEEEPDEEEEEEPMQAKQAGGQTAHVGPGLNARINSMKGGGQPLPRAVRSFFEPRFGYDFSGVRVHTGSQAAEATRSVNARAFTLGKNVVFGAGQYSPGTTGTKKLLGHELAHVVQQTLLGHCPVGEIQRQLVTPHVSGGGWHGVLDRDRRRTKRLRRRPPPPKVGSAFFNGKTIYVSKGYYRFYSCPAITGTAGSHTPEGRYCIRHQGAAQRSGFLRWRRWWKAQHKWYLVEPQFPTKRSRMQLHRGSRSAGCISVTDDRCFADLAAVLNQPGTAQGFGYDGYPPGNTADVDKSKRTINCVAWLTVKY